jgi:hypothetical protein
MKSVRFQSVIDAAGQPEPHLLWVAPEKDKELQKAIREKRVLTVHQSAVGTRADHGTVGFEKTAQGQVLIFPRSLAKFEGKRVVAIRYDLYTHAPVTATAEKLKAERPKKKPKKPHDKPAWSGLKIVEFPDPDAEREKAPETAARSRKKAPAPKARPSPKTKPEPESDAPAELAEVKRKVRQAIKALEGGRQVKAHEILKGLLE